jgi:hypothetical protein
MDIAGHFLWKGGHAMSEFNRHFSPFGDIVIQPPERAVLGDGTSVAVAVEKYRFSWHPPEVIRYNLPEQFQIDCDCIVACDGVRRIVPVGGFDWFIHIGFLAGVAVLVYEERLSPQDRDLFYARHHFFQRARRMPEHLSRRFDASRDLYVRTGGRGGQITHNLLPDGVSFDIGSSAPVEISELTRYGRELARAAGIRTPTNKIAIHYAMVEAARLHPLQLRDGEVAGLIRAALFEESSICVTPDAHFLEIVTDRLLAWFASHLRRPQEAFDRAFFPGKSNFIKAIADQPTSPGGVLPHDDVRQALLHLGWQSYEDVSRCLARFVSWLLESLPEPLDNVERRLFEQVYLPQPHFGNLPLALLKERGGFIRNVVTGLWENPGDNLLIGALHRLLDVYRQMAVNRREADRRFKHRAGGAGQNVHEVTGQEWAFLAAAAPRTTNDIFDAIAEFLATRWRLACDWCGGTWTARVVRQEASSRPKGVVELEVVCECGRITRAEVMSVDEFRRLAARFIDSN